MEVNAQLVSQVKRINQRYVDLVKTFGENDEVVKNYEKFMSKISTVTTRDKNGNLKVNTSKSGHIAIAKPSKLTDEDIKIIAKLDKFRTKGQQLKYRETQYINIYGKKPTKKQILEFSYSANEIHNFIEEHSNYIYNVNDNLTNALHRGSNLNSDEIKQMLDLIKTANETNYDITQYNDDFSEVLTE